MPPPLCLQVGLLVGLIFVLIPGALLQRQESELKSLLHDTDVNRGPLPESTSDDDDFEVEFIYPQKEGFARPVRLVKRLWGFPDTKAYVGRLFSYLIPADAFEGDVKTYQFTSLPSWLWFNERQGVLEGAPAPSDEGFHYVRVQATGTHGDAAHDDFAIQVVNVPESTLLKEGNCSPKQDASLLSIILDKNTADPLLPRDVVSLLKSLSKMLGINHSKVSLVSASEPVDPLNEEGAIMAGPGTPQEFSVSPSERLRGQIHVQTVVGCNGEVNKKNKNVISILNISNKSGKLERLIGHPVVGWLLTKVNPGTRRVRREVEGSGDYDDTDFEENDYEYDYEEYFLNKALGRAVPSLATPVFSDPGPTAYPGGPPASPVFKAVPISTPVFVPVKPTRVVEPSPTVTYKTQSPLDTFDRQPDLESSLLTHPTTSADYTTPLTTTTSVHAEPSKEATSPIDVTSVPTDGETTEYVVKNFPPRIQNRIQKLAWIAGSVYRMQIPEDTFIDVEDGGSRNLTLSLNDENGSAFSRDSWIQFEPTKQEVYALPLEKNIGRYHFRLQASDRGRKSILDHLEINVWQNNRARNFHHMFTAVFKVEKKYEYDFVYSLDWQVKAVEKIAAVFKDSVSNINVRNITTNPAQLSWTNTSLVESQSTVCPTEELEAIAEVMLAGHGPEPSRYAKQVFMPEFQLKKINSHFYDPCEPHFHHGRHHTHSETNVQPIAPVEGTDGEAKPENTAPIVRNQIDQLEATVGHLFRYQVPDNTCYDFEDGNSRNLKLRTLTVDLSTPPKNAWLQFDSANQEFFGLPLHSDVGRMEYFLECMDKGGESVSDALIVEVTEDPLLLTPQPVLFRLTIDTPYEAFMSNAYDKARFMERLGRAFGDAGPENVGVQSLHEGSVLVEWHNTSLPNEPCPYEEVGRLRSVMTDDNGQLRQQFKEAFLPDFVVSSGEAIVPTGSCLAGDTPTHPEEPDIPEGASAQDEEIASSTDEDYLLTFIIPAVIIAVLLLLAALIACCLYRRRRYGKMSMAGDRTFVSKGIPIIFAEELDDHRPDNAKSPVIMKEEKPPLPPPEYQRNSPPRVERQPQRPASGGDMNSSEDAPYHRPPPFTASNGGSRNQRPNLPPAYRKPPTYVPP